MPQTNGVLTTDTFPNAYEGTPERKTSSGHEKLLSFLEMSNIAEELSQDDLEGVGERVVREYEIDDTSRSEWVEKNREAMDMAMQIAEEKHYPWPKASNVKYPLITTGAIQFAARAYPAIIQGDAIVKGKVIGDDRGRPEMDPSGQPVVQQVEGPEGPVQQPVWRVPPGAKRDRADRIGRHMSYQLLEDMPEWEEDTDKLLHIIPIVGCVFRKTWFDSALGRNRSELIQAERFVVNYKAKSLETAPRATQEIDLYPHEIIERERSGLFLEGEYGIPHEAEAGDEDAPHLFLEQHRLLDLDKDGYPEPYIVTVHKETAKVVRIVARFDEEGVFVNSRGEVAKIEPVDYFTKYSFIPNPDGGFYDIGLGWLLAPLNDTINTSLNQMLDAGHLQNTGGGFIAGGMRLKAGSLKFRPGEYKVVNPSGGAVKDNIVPLPFPGPSAVLFSLLEFLLKAASDISSVKDIMTGDEGPANEAAASRLARIEQGMKVFTAIYKRVYRSLKSEFRKLYRLNSLYLEDEQYFTLHDNPEAIARKDYAAEDSDVVPVADPTTVSDMQKLARAQFLLEFAADPYFNGRAIRERVLDAASIPEIDQILIEGNPAPDPQVAESADKIEIEKAKLALESEKWNSELGLAAAKAEAEIAEIESKIIKNLADAEAAEAGPQLEQYKQQMALLIENVRAKARNDQGRVRSVAGSSGN